MKRTNKLGFKLGIAFTVFSVVVLLIVGILIYICQMRTYKNLSERNIKNVGRYIRSLIVADGTDFIHYRDYYLDHYTEANVPKEADEYKSYERDYHDLFASRYPGKTLDLNITFDELDEDVKNAYFIYSHLYWLITFESARTDFNLPYTYFLIPNEEDYTAMYFIDCVRSSRADYNELIKEHPEYDEFNKPHTGGLEYMHLGDTVQYKDEKYKLLWDTWRTGKEQNGFVVWDNDWGDTYSYYVPVFVDGEKVGLVVTETDISDLNEEIMRDTLHQVIVVAFIFVIGIASLLLFINKKYTSKTAKLEAYVAEYTTTRDPGVADKVRDNIKGNDEIASLAYQFIDLIKEIEHHIKYLLLTNQELAQTKGDVAKMTSLAQKDALTGVSNRTAYEKGKEDLQQKLDLGYTSFGIAMVDLNYLKRTNDTYGHEKGNESLKILCRTICEVFEHSPVFRIGGDEFVVILVNEDFKNRDALLMEFNNKIIRFSDMDGLEPWERISAAIGIAVFDRTCDRNVDDVFNRADDIMYERKKEMKASRG
ncbi:MAG: GGDEF domain-containing protein [Lachnospiraceae bacterium]|nr:GGDEF domain-containing protein [Lachnospiraceae bacterium]